MSRKGLKTDRTEILIGYSSSAKKFPQVVKETNADRFAVQIGPIAPEVFMNLKMTVYGNPKLGASLSLDVAQRIDRSEFSARGGRFCNPG